MEKNLGEKTIVIETVTGKRMEFTGNVTTKDFDKDGTIFYVNGSSFPEEIVFEVK